ncbi:hypothetical protein TNCV_3277661 [Trichonephila clavipes]|nr:hypothetical protein TNCV_3277661 [Trichonephila clavipes]
MLRYKKSYNLVLQELIKKFPESVNKLTGGFIKIQTSNIEEHRAITALLKQKREEFYVIFSPAVHPLKVVMKGFLLPLRLRISKRTSPKKSARNKNCTTDPEEI